MKKDFVKVYCKNETHGFLDFYLHADFNEFLLFRQTYRTSVARFFSNGVLINKALDFSGTNHNTALIRTISKLPAYIRYIEKEYGVTILEQTRRKQDAPHHRPDNRKLFVNQCSRPLIRSEIASACERSV